MLHLVVEHLNEKGFGNGAASFFVSVQRKLLRQRFKKVHQKVVLAELKLKKEIFH